jgi:hypothetical protein
VTAYVRSVTPVRNEVQPPVYRAPSHAELIPGAEKPMSEEELQGIGGWTDAEIKQALVKGVGRDGRTFKPPMARHIYFSKMTEDDLNSLVVWLRTLPPLE